MPWARRSDWLQPWRGYLDTVPASTLLQAMGINFNLGGPKAIPVYAELMHRVGFTRARLEVGWDEIDYAHPSRLDPSALKLLKVKLRSLQSNDIRPLILLNADDQQPTPDVASSVTLTQPAPQGASTVDVAPQDVGRIRLDRTGLKLPGDHRAVSDVITSVSPTGVATLSLPLAESLAAGPVPAETLLAAPFGPVTLADGQPNPTFQATMTAWLHYVATVTTTARRILGDREFDVEVWNELGFGSTFITPNAYWAGATKKDAAAVRTQIIDQTVGYVRDPAHGVSTIGVGDGFTDEEPFGSGATTPAGLTAIDKHPYAGPRTFPAAAGTEVAKQPAVGALGQPTSYSPHFSAFLPEWFLTGLQTETLVRDLAPFTTYIGRGPHGRKVHEPGAAAPQEWITEVNLDAMQAAKKLNVPVTTPQARWLEAKAVLRYYTAYVNKGISALYLYALGNAGGLSVVNQAYLSALKSESKRTAKAAGKNSDAVASHIPINLADAGPAAVAISRLAASMRGAQPIANPRQLQLDSVGQFGDAFQFQGKHNPNTPTLYNRDVLAFLPFEVTPKHFVVPVYVMTRNLLEVQQPRLPASAKTRFDLEPEMFRLTIGNLPSCALGVTASDPMYGSTVAVQRVSCTHGRLVVDMPVVDYPRLLSLTVR